jgi:hypothetical protein
MMKEKVTDVKEERKGRKRVKGFVWCGLRTQWAGIGLPHSVSLVAGEADATIFDRFGEAAADGTENEGGHVALGF